MKYLLITLAAIALFSSYPALAQELTDSQMDALVQKIKDEADHSYSYQNGLSYGYQKELSQNQKDAGVATSPLIFLRYYGYKGSVYTVGIDDSGEEDLISCDLRQACEFMTTKVVVDGEIVHSDISAAEGTIAQAALFDAIAGNLVMYNPNVDKVMQDNGWNTNEKYSDALISTLNPQEQKYANQYWEAEHSCGFTDPETAESKKNCEIANHAYRELHKINICWTQDSPYDAEAQHRWGICPPGEDLIIGSIPPEPAPVVQPPTPVTPTNPNAESAPTTPPPPPAAQSATIKPSFDCRKAYFADEVTICNTPALAELDDKLALKYAQAKSAAKDYKAFIAVQRSALLARRDCHTDVSCLNKWYQDRNTALDSIINSAAQ